MTNTKTFSLSSSSKEFLGLWIESSPCSHLQTSTGEYIAFIICIYMQLFILFLPSCFLSLCSCILVSHNWYDIISQKPRHLEQIKSHLKSCSENAKKPSLPLNANVGTRRALTTISNTLPHSQNFPPPTRYKAEPTQKHRPCPTCQSPARQLNLRRATCTNQKCQLDFCQKCFRPWHEGECVDNRGSRSPKRSQSTLIACSQKSKKRLRRL